MGGKKTTRKTLEGQDLRDDARIIVGNQLVTRGTLVKIGLNGLRGVSG